MQRLFSIFPDGWPGGGLLVLRLAAGGCFFVQGALRLAAGGYWESAVAASLGIAAGILMLIGFWTPLGCFLGAVAGLWLFLGGVIGAQAAVLLLSISAAAAMLGPGFWSIDGVLFGRRRLDMTHR